MYQLAHKIDAQQVYQIDTIARLMIPTSNQFEV